MLNEVIANSYKIVEKSGAGGVGEVFRGVDINLDRDVAIKVMRTELARRPEILRALQTERLTALHRCPQRGPVTLKRTAPFAGVSQVCPVGALGLAYMILYKATGAEDEEEFNVSE